MSLQNASKATPIPIYSLVLRVVTLRDEASTAIEIMQSSNTAIATRCIIFNLQDEYAGFTHFKLVRHRAHFAMHKITLVYS